MNASGRRNRGKRGRWPARLFLLAAMTCATAQSALAHWSVRPLASVDVYDRISGGVQAVYEKDGQRYVIGTPGHEYEIRIRNRTGERILAVTSVDGVNVVSGETASPAQSGYVIHANGGVEIAGWRRSLERTSAFYFTDLGDSYAARTGRPKDVGVIGVAVFRERSRANALSSLRDKPAAPQDARRERGDSPASPGSGAAAESTTQARPLGAAPKLGTGFGRDETSYAEHVRFERASESPVETIAIQYDRRDNLIGMGVLPRPRYAHRAPDPFPAMQFVPAPPR